MSAKVLYKTEVRVTGGRDGRAEALDGSLNVKLALPKELGGAGGEGNNPEQLFAAGYAACFFSAMKGVAAQNKHLKVPSDSTVTATVGIFQRNDGGFALNVDLAVDLPGVDRPLAEELVQKAHEICPYSNATRNNIDVGLTVV
jgi:Ohr subfamily peroxiredoxin